MEAAVESGRRRIADLDRLFSRIYKDNTIGKPSDKRYSQMASEYEAELKQLFGAVSESEKQLAQLQKNTVKLKMLYRALREFANIKELTSVVVTRLVERIEIHSHEKKRSHNNVKVYICFTAVGLFDIPTEQQLLKMLKQPQSKNDSSRNAA